MIQPIDPVGRRPPSIPRVAPAQAPARRERDAHGDDERRREHRGEEDRRAAGPPVDADGHIDVRA